MSDEDSKRTDDAADQNGESPTSIEDLFGRAGSDGTEEERVDIEDSTEAADGIEDVDDGSSDGPDGATERENVDEVREDSGSRAKRVEWEPHYEADDDVDVSTGDREEGDDSEAVASDDDVGAAIRDEYAANAPNDGAGPSGVGAGVELIGVDDRTDPPKQFGGGTEGSDGRFSTGIDELDNLLGGGIPPGRILSLVAPSDTQSELFVKHLAAQHDCLYLSTLRPKWEVEEEVTDYVQKHSGPESKGRSVHVEQLTPGSRLDSARTHFEQLKNRRMVVVDAANELEEQQKDHYIYLLDDVKRKLWETGCVGLFYCIEEERPPVCRDITLRRADMIWRLQEASNPDSVHHRLTISKFRSGGAMKEPLTVYLTDEVRVEASPFSI